MTDSTPTLEQLLGLDNDGEGGNDNEPSTDGKGLRAQLRQLLAENKQLREQNAKVAERERTRTAAELVAKHNIPAVAQGLLLKEIGDGDLTDEAVTQFVSQYGELWGAKAAEASTTPEQQAQTQQVQALTANATPVDTGLQFDEAANRGRFAEAKTKEDVMRMVAEATNGVSVLGG